MQRVVAWISQCLSYVEHWHELVWVEELALMVDVRGRGAHEFIQDSENGVW